MAKKLKIQNPPQEPKRFYSSQPWHCRNHKDHSEIVAYVEASGAWEVIATIKITSGISADGLRDALANDPDMAFLAVLHALVQQVFYRYATVSCLEITAKSSGFSVQAPDLKTCASAIAIEERHELWEKQLPKDEIDLWDILRTFDADSRMSLFAHCSSLTVNAVHEPWNRAPGRKVHADQLAETLALDMAAIGWQPTAANYLGRVSKARILEAVTDIKGASSAELIGHLRKLDMAQQAERMLAGSGWLPEPLRTPGIESLSITAGSEAAETLLPLSVPSGVDAELPAFLTEAA